MFNQKIIDRINNLTYLKALKNSNASAITKKNPYGDIVKFYAQINKNDVIQAITFKCTGCSYFTALCSYFCELVEGKTVDEALKIKEKDLVAFAKLDESRHHIYPLILGTFALLVKRYRKALELGKVEPCDVVEVVKVEKKVAPKKKAVDVSKGLKDILVSNTAKSSKISKTTTKTTITTEVISQTETNISSKKTIKASAKEEKINGVALEQKATTKAKTSENKQVSDTQKSQEKSVTAKDKPAKVVKEKVAKEIKNTPVKVAKEKSVKEETVVAPKTIKEEKIKKNVTSKTSKITAIKSSEENTRDTKKVASKRGLFGRKDKQETMAVNDISLDKDTPKRVKSVDLAIINKEHDEHYEESENHDVIIIDDGKNATQVGDVIVSNAVNDETQNHSQVIVQTVEQKRSIKTTVKNGETTTVAGEQINAMSLHAEGEGVHKQVHSATNLNDMISRLNSSKSKINSVEAHSMTRVEKSVNGKTVDSASTLTSFSSMRDSLHRMRENNVGASSIEQKKALPVASNMTSQKKASLIPSKSKTKEDEEMFVERTPKSKDIAKEVKEKEEKGTKRGLFSRLFKK